MSKGFIKIAYIRMRRFCTVYYFYIDNGSSKTETSLIMFNILIYLD